MTKCTLKRHAGKDLRGGSSGYLAAPLVISEELDEIGAIQAGGG